MAEPTAVQRRSLAKLGYAMPDGSYFIRVGSVGASDLQNAISAVGRGQDDSHSAIRRYIIRRAKNLGLSDKIPTDWTPDGSLKHGDDLARKVEESLKHFGIDGMRWGHHLPGTEAVGGPGNPDGNSKPAPFIRRGDHAGDSGQPDHEQQAKDSIDALKALRDQADQHAASTQAEADKAPEQVPQRSASDSQGDNVPLPQAKAQATQIAAAAKKNQAAIALAHNKAVAAAATHKAQAAKLSKKAAQAAAKVHAAHLAHLKQIAQKTHAAHLAHVAKLKKASHNTTLNAQDKAALAKLSPTQKSALAKLTPQQRASLGKMTAAQRAKLHLTAAEKTAISHLSPKQKAALAKATAASAKKRHEAALAKKAGATTKSVAKKPAANSPAAAKKLTTAAQAKRTASQKAAFNRLRLNAQNHIRQSATHDQVEEFLEHFGVKGQKWGVRRNGGHPGAVKATVPAGSSADHQHAALIKAKAKSHGGVHALSNDELKALSDRLNLEANYHRLNPQTGKLDKGRQFVKSITGDAKTVLDAVETGRRVVKLAQTSQASDSSHQSRRTRNKPLKVVSVNAA